MKINKTNLNATEKQGQFQQLEPMQVTEADLLGIVGGDFPPSPSLFPPSPTLYPPSPSLV